MKLTDADRERLATIQSCIRGQVTNAEAAAKLSLTVRQVQRLKRAVREHGVAAVAHGNRGRTSNRATDAKTTAVVVTFLRKRQHRDFGPTFAQEQLTKRGTVLSVETVRTLMVRVGLWAPRRRRGPSLHRAWRERMGLSGALVQFDGSYHDWFETGEEACLLAAIDDATGVVPHAVFEDNEGVLAVFRFWWTYLEAHGRPVAIYLDRFSTYKVNHPHAVDNAQMRTQFERAMAELDIRVICANSPEAKGRVERLFGTLQDRLVKELRLAGAKDRDSANAFLATTYLPEHNARFSVPARQAGDAHRPLTDELRAKLPAIFSVQSQRRVNSDFTLQFQRRWLQLSEVQGTTVYKGDTVTVEERLDGALHVRLRGVYLAYIELPERPVRVRMNVTALTREKQAWIPPVNHPWRNRQRAGER